MPLLNQVEVCCKIFHCTGEAIIEMRETENGGDSTESEGEGDGEGGEVGQYQVQGDALVHDTDIGKT